MTLFEFLHCVVMLALCLFSIIVIGTILQMLVERKQLTEYGKEKMEGMKNANSSNKEE